MKNIIYGTGTYQRDVQYVFDDLVVDYYIDDIPTDEVRPVESILTEQDYRVIICKEDKAIACERLNNMKLQYKKDYIHASDLFDELNGDFYKSKKQLPKQLVVWGTGRLGHLCAQKFQEKEILYFIDSNPEKEGTFYHGVPIKSPQRITDWTKFFLVIAVNVSDEIEQFLKEKGLQKNLHYVTYEQIADTPSEMMEQVLTEPKKNYAFCNVPFEEVYIEVGGVTYLCCPYMINNMDVGALKRQEFDEIWNSKKAKIIRLSMIKRNFCFCNEKYCSHFKQETNCERSEDYDKKAESYPKKMMVSFDDSCNLKCPSCRHEFRLNGQVPEKQSIAERCAEKLQHVIPNIDLVSIAGNGDPFYCTTYRKLWENPSKQKRKAIRFQTNGLLMNETAMKKVMDGYETIYLYVSVDATKKETFEALRMGGKWEVFLRNMGMISKMRREHQIQELSISFVVQRANYLEMKAFVHQGILWNADIINFYRLANWNIYDEETFRTMSMYDKHEKRLPELEEMLEDEIFKDSRVRLNNI